MACTSLSTSLETDSLYFLSLGTLAFEIQPPQFEEAPVTYGKSHIEELKPGPMVLATVILSLPSYKWILQPHIGHLS